MSEAHGPTIGPGAYVAPGVQLGQGVVVQPNAVVLAGEEGGMTTVLEEGALIGANATILPGLTVGFEAQVRPGAVVTRSVPPRAIADGNPARIVGYVDADLTPRTRAPIQHGRPRHRESRVRGVQTIELTTAVDMRGSLAVAEADEDVPFKAQRWFLVYGVPSAETRGEHAHRECEQLLIAVAGRLRVVLDDGTEREEFVLDSRTTALYVPAMVWGIQYDYSPDAVLLVLASLPYDPADYIRDYAEFLIAASGH